MFLYQPCSQRSALAQIKEFSYNHSIHAIDLQTLAARSDLQDSPVNPSNILNPDHRSRRLYRQRSYDPRYYQNNLPERGSFDSIKREKRLQNARRRMAFQCWRKRGNASDSQSGGIGEFGENFDEYGVSAWDRKWVNRK